MATRYFGVHDECGYVGSPTTRGRAERGLREHSCDRHRPTAAAEGHQEGPNAATGEPCGLSIDLPGDVAAPAEGDWIVTRAGSRYLITSSRPVQPRAARDGVRYQLRCLRLARHIPVPADVRAIGLRWYARGRRRRPPAPAASALVNAISPDEER
jgi:hypothetical protein